MWVVRQLARLAERIVVLVAVAGVVAVLVALRTGEGMRIFRLALIVAGGIIVALGAMGSGSSYQREADMRAGLWARSWTGTFVPSSPSDPQLAPGAALAISGVIAILIGFFV